MNKLMTYGTKGFDIMVKPLPNVIRRAILTYWVSVAVTGIVNWAFGRLRRKGIV